MAPTTANNREDDLLPGTEVVFKDNGELAQGELILPQRPLNWSKTWKTIIIANQFVFVFISIMTPLAIAPMTQIFEAEFHKTLPQVNMLFGAAAITLGYANFLIVPAANVFGRRPIIIICGLICILANIWQGLVTSYSSFIGARVISGLGAAANESIMPMVISDILFVHQRGRSMTFYFGLSWAYFMGLFIGPIISGAIASQISWRWFFWVCTILQGASWILTIIAHPETKYERPSQGSPSNSVFNISYQSEKQDGPTGSDTEGRSFSPSTVQVRPVGRPSKEQFSIIPRIRFDYSLAKVTRDIVSPLQIFSFPIVLWASLTMGFAANCLLALNLTQAQVFGPPPYLFTPDQIGFVNFAFVVGAAVALVTAGPLADWIALRRARKNGGVLEAEFRLPALIPYVALCLVGMTVTAVGYQRSWPWAATVVAGYMLVGIQVVGIPAIAIAYAVDCYKSLPGEIMIAATIVKNTFGFGMIFFFNDWAATGGYLAPVLTLMAITVGFCVIGLAVFIPSGKKFRRMTKDSKLHAL
ncbi:MFS general substrate transporter [Apiospora phragmitis]|uniref:MFS general substrate transporter n=1 Tax=Apiospora phragmitis TaxID=2905665 RepID=A0ABR1T9M9_9PEZI